MEKLEIKWVGLGVAFVLLSPLAVNAQENAQEEEFPDRFAINIGSFYVMDSDTDFDARRADRVIGTSIDFERDLSGDDTVTAPRLFGYYRFDPHHRIDFGWNKFERKGDRSVTREISFGDATFPVTAAVESTITTEVTMFTYTYSFYHTPKVELGASIGAHITSYEFDLRTSDGTISDSKSVSEPLPVIGLRMDYTIAHRWHTLFDIATFNIAIGDKYRGSLDELQLAVEYRAAKNFVVGASANRVVVDAEISDDEYNGSISDLYRGAQLYVGLRY